MQSLFSLCVFDVQSDVIFYLTNTEIILLIFPVETARVVVLPLKERQSGVLEVCGSYPNPA